MIVLGRPLGLALGLRRQKLCTLHEVWKQDSGADLKVGAGVGAEGVEEQCGNFADGRDDEDKDEEEKCLRSQRLR